MKRLPIDHEAREKAVLTSSRRVLVVAGAGTGKTHLLVDRISALVASGTPLDRIVAITFTEKAAGELRARIRDAVAAGATKRVRGMSEARAAVDRAPISTIHAFAAAILRRHPIEAGLDPAFDVLEEDARQELVEEVWDAWLPRALAMDPGPWLDVVRARRTPGVVDTRTLARDLWAADRHATLRPATGRSPADVLAEVRGLAKSLSELARSVPASDLLAETITRFAADAEAARPDPAGVLLLSLPKCGTRGKATFWRGRIDEARRKAEALRDRLGAGQSAIAHDLARGLGEWLRPFGDALDSALAAKGALDFDGLLRRARDLLRDRPDVTKKVAAEHPHVCVDEYQDTDPVQNEILRLLEAAGSSLFLVGDPKQSIYGFRGADVESFVDAETRAEAGGETHAIVQSFRASARVVETLNAIFEVALPPPRERFEIAHAPLVAHRGPGAPPPALVIVRPPGGEIEGVDAAREAEAAAVVRLLGRMVGEGWPVGDDGRPAGFGDVAILLRKMTDAADAYARVLEEAGIEFLVVGGRRFFLQSEVRALVVALAAIDDPTRTAAVVGALRSPLFGVSDDAILESRGGLDPLHPGGPASPALEVLGALSRSRGALPPHRLLDRLIDQTGLFAALAVKPDGARRIANVGKLVEAARAFGPPGTVSLRAFVRFCEDEGQRLEFGEPEAPVADESEPVLRILSIHAAKGLEFPVVVLGEPSALPANRLPPVLVQGRSLEVRLAEIETEGYQDAKARRAAREGAEERRLLYVALTRARDRIVLPLYGKRGRFAAPLLEALPGALLAPAGNDVDVGRGVRALVAEDDGREETAQAPAIRIADVLSLPSPPADAEPPPIAPGRRRVRPSGEDAPPGSPARSSVGRERARRIGIAVHAALERAPFCDGDAAKAIAISEARALGLADEDATKCAELAGQGANSTHAARAKAALRAWREVPFTWIDGDEIVEGQIDLVYEEADGFVVVDYKTEQTPGDHEAQLARYAAAVAAITGRPVKECVALSLAERCPS